MQFETPNGKDLAIRNWGYQLQGEPKHEESQPLSAKELAKAPHDLLVIDFSKDGSGEGAFTKGEIATLKKRKGARSVIVSYISIGEASDYRDHWQDNWTSYDDAEMKAAGDPTDNAPSWLGDWNENWPNSRKVRYWQDEWKEILFNEAGTGWLDRIIAAGFDGAYLDIVDGYYHWGVEVKKGDRVKGDPRNEKEAAQRMIDLVLELAGHARDRNPEFLIIPQNGALILDALQDEDEGRKQAYLDAISSIACEDLFFRGDEPENNELQSEEDAVAALKKDFVGNGKPVLSVDYLNDPDKIEEYYKQAVAAGFLPYAAPSRELNELGEAYDGSADDVA